MLYPYLIALQNFLTMGMHLILSGLMFSQHLKGFLQLLLTWGFRGGGVWGLECWLQIFLSLLMI